MSLLEERYLRLDFTFYPVRGRHITPLALDIEPHPAPMEKLINCAEDYYICAKDHDYANVTPNGMMMPKVENEEIYTEFASRFFQIMHDLGVFNRFKAWNVPAIRYKEPTFTRAHAQRPRASEYAHSDSWLGWDQSAIVFMIPLLGDVKNNWVQFFDHPLDETWIEVLPSFTCSRAREMSSHCVGVPWNYQIGHIYPNDIGIVHQTRREPACSWRVSSEIVGYLNHPHPDSFAAHTAFDSDTAREIAEGKKRFKAHLKMGEIGHYDEKGRALDVEIT